MIEREYRLVSCDACVWQDFYDTRTRASYPPRCPACGGGIQDHVFVKAYFAPVVRARLGRDLGIRAIFGTPVSEWKRERDRRRNSSNHGYQSAFQV